MPYQGRKTIAKEGQSMLVLTRCPGQGHKATICIGHDVEITVLGIEGDQVQVAITAPPSLSIAFGSSAPEGQPGQVHFPPNAQV